MLAEWREIEKFMLDPIIYRRRIEQRKRAELERALKARARLQARRKKLKLW